MAQNQSIPYTQAQISQAQKIGELQQQKEINDLKDRVDEQLRQRIFYNKHKILRALRKLFKFLMPHKNFATALQETKDLIAEATGVNIDIADNLSDMADQNRTTTEALQKTCDNLEKISLVLTKTSERIESKGADITQMRGDRKGAEELRNIILDTFEECRSVVQHDIESVSKGKPNMKLYQRSVDGDIYLASISKDKVTEIYKLKIEENNGYSFYPQSAVNCQADELTEMCKITNARGEIKNDDIKEATRTIMKLKDPQFSKTVDEVNEEITTEKRFFIYYDNDNQKYNIRDRQSGQTLIFDFSKPNEITADLWSNNEKNAPHEIKEKNVIVLKNAESGIEHNVVNREYNKFIASALKTPETLAVFKQFGIENVAELLITKDNNVNKKNIENTIEKYTKHVDAPKPVYLDDKTFPDNNLRRALQEQFGTDMVKEPDKVTELSLSRKGIHDLTGLDNFSNLVKLDVSKNMIEGDVSLTFPALASLSASDNMITNLKLDAPLARSVDLTHNSLTKFDNTLPLVETLNLSNNNIREINFSAVPNVSVLDLTNNEIKHIDGASSLSQLEQLKCGSNLIENDVVINSDKLSYLRVEDNNITSLVVNSAVPLLMVEADRNPMSEAFISETKMMNFPQSCEVKSITEAPKEKQKPKDAVFVAVTSVSSNGEIEATTYHEDGTPAIGADKAAAVNAHNTEIADTDFTRGGGVSKSAALKGSDSVETRTVVTEQRHTEEYRENSREEYQRDEKEDNQRFKDERATSKGGDER